MRNLHELSLNDIAPGSLLYDRSVKAMVRSIDSGLRDATKCIKNISIIPRIKEIADSALIDQLAWHFHVDFYDPTLPLEVRRELVLKSLDWHSRKGVPQLIEDVVSTVFSQGKIQEWFEYGGEPHFFRIRTTAPLRTVEEYRYFFVVLETVKRKSSWLDRIVIESKSQGALHSGSYSFITHTYTSPIRNQMGV